jgi:hypothetical protein
MIFQTDCAQSWPSSYSRRVSDGDALPDYVDPELWFEIDSCGGRHYLLDDSPSILGRMYAYCPRTHETTRVSKGEMTAFSEAAGYFVRGFLAGSQPPPPLDEEGMLVQDQAAVAAWRRAVEDYRATGIWRSHRPEDQS